MIGSDDKKKQLKKLNGKSIQYILNNAYNILGNPIALFDTSYNLWAFTEGIITDDWLWNELTTLGAFSPETVDFFNTENFILSFAESEVITLMQSDRLKYDRISGKLFDYDDVQLGNINVVACSKSFDEGDAELIETLCTILSVELQNSGFYQKIERVYQDSPLDDLIRGNIKESVMANAKMAELQAGLEPNLYLAVVDITEYEPTNTHLAYFRDLFRKLQPEYKYYIYMNNIVIIISTAHALLSVKRDLHKLNAFFKKYNIYSGISSRFYNLCEMKEYFQQAINALNYGLTSKRKQQIFNYDNFSTEHFLQNNIEDAKGVCSQITLLIQEYDRINNSSLMDILYYYLLYAKDIPMASAAAGLTPEELSRGLKKLGDLFEIDWKDGNMLVNLFLSIKLLDRDK